MRKKAAATCLGNRNGIAECGFLVINSRTRARDTWPVACVDRRRQGDETFVLATYTLIMVSDNRVTVQTVVCVWM